MARPLSDGIVLLAHGARDPQWAEPFHALKARVAARQPGAFVEVAFLEIMQPSLAEVADCAVGRGCASLTVVPLFMAQGGHLKRDLPRRLSEVRATHPQLAMRYAPAIGNVAAILDAIAAWIIDLDRRDTLPVA